MGSSDPPPPIVVGELQLAILSVLWRRGEATVLEVHAGLAGREASASTVGTMLQKMERRALVRHRAQGRRYLYRATVEEHEVRRGMVGELTRRLFGGDARELLLHLVREEEIGAADLERLRAELARREGQVDPGAGGEER